MIPSTSNISIPTVCEDRGARLGLPASFDSTESMMLLLSGKTFPYNGPWRPYLTDLMCQLVRDPEFDPLRLFAGEDVNAIVSQASSEMLSRRLENGFWSGGFTKKSVAALIIDDGIVFHDIPVADWSRNPVVALRHKANYFPDLAISDNIPAMEYAASQTSFRIRMLNTMFEAIVERVGASGLIEAASSAAKGVLCPYFQVDGDQPVVTPLMPNFETTANFLQLIGMGAVVEPKHWDGHLYSLSSILSLAHLVALDATQLTREHKARILNVLHETGHPLESQHDHVTQPLHIFASGNQVECVRVLLNFGVNISKANDQGHTPRDIAKKKNYHDVVALIDAAAAQNEISNVDAGGLLKQSIRPL